MAVATQGGGEGSNDLLFKNITQILDLLLKDYDNSQHPNYQEGRPTTIRTNILIKSMGPISELDMDYSMDCYFRQSWRDPRLSFRGPVDKLSLNIKMLERLWRPDTYFHNGKNSYVHTITVPNKLLRISQEGDILYSMRLTIKAKCPMCLRNFPMDTQSCPLIIGSYAYTSQHIVYHWDKSGVAFVAGMTLSQFDLTSSPYQNLTLIRKEGKTNLPPGLYSVLQVNFNLERHAGYFLIQVYVPCVLIVVLSWVSFWINREATSDRVGLGITAVLTLSTISLDSRTDLPKVHYATALDWFLLACFGYCMATLLEFSGVHYFTKIGSGETLGLDEEDEWDVDEDDDEEWTISHKVPEVNCSVVYNVQESVQDGHFGWRGNPIEVYETTPSKSMESKETQTERKMSCFRQFLRCVVADLEFRRERMRASIAESSTNSVSKIDRISRVLFPVSFTMLNIFYWVMYYHISDECPRNRANFDSRL
ncbi:Gamma-aminobutyric acid receptor subunit alpha-6 [Folsomia candida]|uniref:Gamma-aminobutyric acid receptor subunit alpha-6 n=3 Tax=Folsomia candida TaxID=158441 RepID=A0A226E691_FOLCA|nr:Gamma-aminobutyric acid receptor subunit alpha-6 [Folsomia candida]